MTKIEWATKSWNPVVGCTPVSEGCRNCYAAVHAHRMGGNPKTSYYKGLTKKMADGRIVYNGEVRWVRHKLEQPNDWKKPHRIFVNSMSDLFHEQVPDSLIREVFEVMLAYDWHTYLILTKRPERMAQVVPHLPFLPHVWLGVSIENQQAADERIPRLLKTPAAVRWLSCEPLLGPVDLRFVYEPEGDERLPFPCFGGEVPTNELHWVVCGDESGPRRRECDPRWVRELRDQCMNAKVPFFLKQLHGVKMPMLGGRTWDQYPKETP